MHLNLFYTAPPNRLGPGPHCSETVELIRRGGLAIQVIGMWLYHHLNLQKCQLASGFIRLWTKGYRNPTFSASRFAQPTSVTSG